MQDWPSTRAAEFYRGGWVRANYFILPVGLCWGTLHSLWGEGLASGCSLRLDQSQTECDECVRQVQRALSSLEHSVSTQCKWIWPVTMRLAQDTRTNCQSRCVLGGVCVGCHVLPQELLIQWYMWTLAALYLFYICLFDLIQSGCMSLKISLKFNFTNKRPWKK